jgi:poly(A) polymerase
VFPVLDAVLAPSQPNPQHQEFVRLALQDTDRRVEEGRAVVPSFMLACMLWSEVQTRWKSLLAAGEPPYPALQTAVDAVFDARIGDISGRGKLAADMREVWLMQPRFDRRTPSSAASLAGQVRFRAGYDFLRLRAEVGEVAPELADWWEDFHLGDEDEREALLEDARASAPAKVHRVPSSSPATQPADADGADDAAMDATPAVGGDAPPRRKRRRRRRPAGEGGAAGGGTDGGAPQA